MREELRSGSSIKPSAARRPAASGVIGNAGRGGGGEGLFRSDVHTLCAPSRVQFRAEVLQRRKEEREARELERQRGEEEKQNRLEVLRNQVDHYLLLTFSTTLIVCGSSNDPPGRTCSRSYLSRDITAPLWREMRRQLHVVTILNVLFLHS